MMHPTNWEINAFKQYNLIANPTPQNAIELAQGQAQVQAFDYYTVQINFRKVNPEKVIK